MSHATDLKEKIAVVTGASRGAGRGIALVLGGKGATVYVTGRSVRGQSTSDNLPGTLEDTSEEVTARGGVGIPVRCDHTVDAEIEALFARIKQEQGHLDLLVNNAWSGYEGYDKTFDAPFWEQPLWRWNKMLQGGVWSSMVTSYFAVPLMLEQRQGLIINTGISSGVKDWEFENHDDVWTGPIPVFYDTSKTAINRMAFGMAHNLRPYHIAVVALSLGWMRTERIMRDHTPSPEDMAKTQSVEYVGRAVEALWADSNVMEKTGRLLSIEDVAREYDFTDIDGRRPNFP